MCSTTFRNYILVTYHSLWCSTACGRMPHQLCFYLSWPWFSGHWPLTHYPAFIPFTVHIAITWLATSEPSCLKFSVPTKDHTLYSSSKQFPSVTSPCQLLLWYWGQSIIILFAYLCTYRLPDSILRI